MEDGFGVEIGIEPEKLKAYRNNEINMSIAITSGDIKSSYWCECDVEVKPPLSLASDRELSTGRTRMGIIGPNGRIAKPIHVYTRPNNFPAEYELGVTAYIYDSEGTIAKRIDKKSTVICEE
ncbi:MAG: hypothetical protein M1559_02825 [Candidatus Marsarchaeota archaeon]|jgi:hypothetical protein|uniref:Uncharacterized protein n=1 Tax=Candidatus Micrarchaeum acidiphilum ARMAN-2 TaxID=425595 RepID=C7DIL0_MICA2|nr:MAG: hypothetical protein UNLARM2_0898 [Candidatus Micrarchaeum acidiphilum ARMAN-2]MCL4411260.1 hypothetical protein [Candidatus Marsarchaeota archaeon]MCL5434620.1 hypothetical protein [Candidatus Marsarchaeota archaeon]MCW6161039.1 hypothetical protein [Candidatus Micrarchaeales archaeon]